MYIVRHMVRTLIEWIGQDTDSLHHGVYKLLSREHCAYHKVNPEIKALSNEKQRIFWSWDNKEPRKELKRKIKNGKNSNWRKMEDQNNTMVDGEETKCGGMGPGYKIIKMGKLTDVFFFFFFQNISVPRCVPFPVVFFSLSSSPQRESSRNSSRLPTGCVDHYPPHQQTTVGYITVSNMEISSTEASQCVMLSPFLFTVWTYWTSYRTLLSFDACHRGTNKNTDWISWTLWPGVS